MKAESEKEVRLKRGMQRNGERSTMCEDRN
jgi:hypothetical protein